MNQTNVGSDIDIVFMSVGKEERGFTIEAAGEKDNLFENNMEIIAEDAELFADDTIKTNRGLKMKFPPESYRKLLSSREARMAVKSKIHGSAKRNIGIEK